MAQYAGRFTGVFRAIGVVYRESGLTGMYRGHSAMLLRIFPYAAINFSVYEQARYAIYKGRAPSERSWIIRILPGSIAGATAVFCTYPLDILRVRMAYHLEPINANFKNTNGVFPNLRVTARQLLNEGRSLYGCSICGLYQGLFPTLAGILPYAGVSFASYEAYKHSYISATNAENMAAHVKFGIGMAAGMTAQTASYPLDVIRRRAQVRRIAPHLQGSQTAHPILYDIRTSSVRALFRGLSINYLKVAPASGVSFLVYETLRERLFRKN